MLMSVLSTIGKFHRQQHVRKIWFLIRKRGLKYQSGAVIFEIFEPIYGVCCLPETLRFYQSGLVDFNFENQCQRIINNLSENLFEIPLFVE